MKSTAAIGLRTSPLAHVHRSRTLHLRLPSRVHDCMPPPLTDARRRRVRTRQRAVAKAESVRLDTWQALTLAINTCYMDLTTAAADHVRLVWCARIQTTNLPVARVRRVPQKSAAEECSPRAWLLLWAKAQSDALASSVQLAPATVTKLSVRPVQSRLRV